MVINSDRSVRPQSVHFDTSRRVDRVKLGKKFDPPFELIDMYETVTRDACIVTIVASIRSVARDGTIIIEEIEATGTSRRSSKDRSNPRTGYFVALQRAWASMGKKIERRAEGYMKHDDDIRDLRKKAKKAARKGTKALPAASTATVKPAPKVAKNPAKKSVAAAGK